MQGRETMHEPCTSKQPAKCHLTASQEPANEHPFYFEEIAPPCKGISPNQS